VEGELARLGTDHIVWIGSLPGNFSDADVGEILAALTDFVFGTVKYIAKLRMWRLAA